MLKYQIEIHREIEDNENIENISPHTAAHSVEFPPRIEFRHTRIEFRHTRKHWILTLQTLSFDTSQHLLIL